MNARFSRTYKKVGADGVRKHVFVYEVSGSKEELEQYETSLTSRGVACHKDEVTGKPLYFSTNFSGNNIKLGFTQDGRCFTDDSQLASMASLANQAGGILGQAIAQQAAAMLLGISAPSAPVETPAPAAVSNTSPDEADI